MNTFDDFSPSAWQEEGVLWLARVVVKKAKRRAKRMAAATALVTLGAAGLIAGAECDFGSRETGVATALIRDDAYEAPDQPPNADLVPPGYWQNMHARARGVVRLVEESGSDPEILM